MSSEEPKMTERREENEREREKKIYETLNVLALFSFFGGLLPERQQQQREKKADFSNGSEKTAFYWILGT